MAVTTAAVTAVVTDWMVAASSEVFEGRGGLAGGGVWGGVGGVGGGGDGAMSTARPMATELTSHAKFSSPRALTTRAEASADETLDWSSARKVASLAVVTTVVTTTK